MKTPYRWFIHRKSIFIRHKCRGTDDIIVTRVYRCIDTTIVTLSHRFDGSSFKLPTVEPTRISQSTVNVFPGDLNFPLKSRIQASGYQYLMIRVSRIFISVFLFQGTKIFQDIFNIFFIEDIESYLKYSLKFRMCTKEKSALIVIYRVGLFTRKSSFY